MSKLTRYTCVANDHDAMEANPDGEYVRFDYANLRIEMLERQLKDAQIKGFKDGWGTGAEGYNSEYGANTDEVVNDYVNNLNSGE